MSFKDHFSGHASAYRQARPVYPDALFDWLAQIAPDRALAWDGGCGNGQASVALAERFARVFATDPSVKQIAHAQARANIQYHAESAEQCSLPTASTDLVTIAQALHWLDVDRFYAQVRRVLKPRGVIAAWTYSHCHVTPAVDVFKERLYCDLVGPYWPPERAFVDAGYRTLPFPFQEIAAPPLEMSSRWPVDHFLAYLRSWSATQRYVTDKGEDPVTLVEAELRAAWGEGERVVHWDFHVRCGHV
ncbi:MAG: class I SAM-dependent methyltransferase [Rhodanobacter sp.]|nr:class I SAM-dependent methyltransferase [Rhodanobacter sp.]